MLSADINEISESELFRLAENLGETLKKANLSVTTAESCTGGGISYCITSVPGSSSWFSRGAVTYSNEAKSEMVGVRAETVKKYGAVSRETVAEMAEGALILAHADFAIAVSGIAGPDGGSEDKPVGTVWFAIAGRDTPTQAKVRVFQGNRDAVRKQTIKEALVWLAVAALHQICP